MPYVDPTQAINALLVRFDAIRATQGEPPWRVPLAAGQTLRSVLLCWPAGHVAPPHRHPRAIEVFVILAGEAEFTFDGTSTVRARRGTHLFAPAGVSHAIRVVGDIPLLFLVALGPNEDYDTEELG